ncbi:MFS transporter, partial [Mesorhizobium sp. B2-7-1]
VMPPLAERLSLRYRPGVIIPAGLATIGIGFFLMKWGSAAAHASWLTMLPGCLIAGAGLGITNTPVTNTTTGSVSRNRAGMASGIDMSARMVSLAVNIAVMGFILASGVLSHLIVVLPDRDSARLYQFAQAIAAGNPVPGLPDKVAQNALANGFGWVMLYGGIGVWIMAAIGFAIFKARPLRHEAVQRPD